MKHLKIQHLSNNTKNTAAVSSNQKNTDFRNSKPPKSTPLIPVCKYAKSTPSPSKIHIRTTLHF